MNTKSDHHYCRVLFFLCVVPLTLPMAAALSPGAVRNYHVVERGADFKVMQSARAVTDGAGRTVNVTNRYIEVATGLNYTNAYGQLTESKEEIAIMPGGGAAALQGRHKVYFPSDIYNGVIEVVTPDGRHLKSRPVGISYDDGSNSVFIAILKPAQGYLTSSNTITYRDAFTAFKADLVCTYRRGGFECDLVFRQQPPVPGDFGMNNSASTLQLVTEFFDTVDPQQITARADRNFNLQDSTLKFGKLTMTRGKAFAIKPPGGVVKGSQTPVYKSWVRQNGRTFLVESVPVAKIARDLDALPRTASLKSKTPHARTRSLLASAQSVFPSAHEIIPDSAPVQIAALDLNQEPGVVLDYNVVNSDQGDFTFYSGETYYISGPFQISGTATFAAGTVLKYVDGYTQITISGAVNCQSTPDRPAIFTSKSDDAAGEIISESTGTPEAGNFYMDLESTSSVELKNLRFLYGGLGASLQGMAHPDVTIKNIQFLHSGYGVAMYGGTLAARNVLMHDVAVAFFLEGTPADVEHLTVDECAWFYSNEGDARSFGLTNSLLVGVGDLSYAPLVTSAVEILSTNPGVFQSVGVGGHYLAPSSSYRNIGTTDIDPDLWTELQAMTTYAPQDGGYADSTAPDLGYHYSVNEDGDYDGMPDSWELKHFGSFTQTGSGDYDDDGISNADEYAGGTDPNTIEFAVNVAYGHVATLNPTGAVDVLSGVPYEMAIKVDTDDLSAPSWQPFNAAPLISLSNADGEHQVWIALRGRVPSTDLEWQKCVVTLDRTAPTVTVTSPSAGVTGKPFVQLSGTANESLSMVRCLVNNSSGWTTNNGFVTGQSGTTVSFNCFDVELTNGVNLLRVEVADLAGNTSHSDVELTFDTSSDSVAPVITLKWPQDAQKIGADTFTLRGAVDDETATVLLTAQGASQEVREYLGNVERNGALWVDDVALEPGANSITLRATDAAGNFTETTMTVERSTVNLTITEPNEDALLQSTVTLSGTISDNTYEVWANGMLAAVSGNSWTAANVPVPSGGSGVFAAAAVPGGGGVPNSAAANPTDRNPGGPNNVTSAIAPEKKAYVELVHGEWTAENDETWHPPDWWVDLPSTRDEWTWRWDELTGGFAENLFTEFWWETPEDFSQWGRRYWLDVDGSQYFESWGPAGIIFTDPFELGLDIKGPKACGHWSYVKFSDWVDVGGSATANNVQWVLHTGGREGVRRQNLFSATASAERKTSPTGWEDIPKQEIQVPNFGPVSFDGVAYAALPDNEPFLITPSAPASYYRFDVQPKKHRMKIFANSVLLEPSRVVSGAEFSAGQKVILNAQIEDPPEPSITVRIGQSAKWEMSGDFRNAREVAKRDGEVEYIECTPCYPSNPVSIGARPTGESGTPCTKYVKHDSLLNYPTIGAWWINKGEVNASCEIKLEITSDGQTTTIKIKDSGLFNVLRPTISISGITPRYFTGNYFGVYLGDIANAAGGMNYDINVESERPGWAAITQLILPDYSFPGPTYTEYRLDGNELYSKNKIAGNTGFVNFHDFPSNLGGHRLKAEYKDYIRFQPLGDGNIYVTLGVVTWKIHGEAELDSDTQWGWDWLYWVTPDPVGPVDSTEFPSWSKTWLNQYLKTWEEGDDE